MRSPSSGKEQRRAATAFQKHTDFPERLDQEVQRLQIEAEKLPPGIERDLLLRKARQAETARDVDKWLTSPGLKVPN